MSAEAAYMWMAYPSFAAALFSWDNERNGKAAVFVNSGTNRFQLQLGYTGILNSFSSSTSSSNTAA